MCMYIYIYIYIYTYTYIHTYIMRAGGAGGACGPRPPWKMLYWCATASAPAICRRQSLGRARVRAARPVLEGSISKNGPGPPRQDFELSEGMFGARRATLRGI